MKKLLIGALLSFVIIESAFAQQNPAQFNPNRFIVPGNTTLVPADEVGRPNVPFGNVRTSAAPLGGDNRNNARIAYRNAGIPNSIIDLERFLGCGTFARQISSLRATTETGNRVRRVTSVPVNFPPASNNVIYINSKAELNDQRANIASGDHFTFIFQGTMNVDSPIQVGSNTTIWIDGVLNYDGVDAVRTAFGAAFTPRPSKYDGVFNVRAAAVFKDEALSPANRTDNLAILDQKFKPFRPNYQIDNIKIYGTRKGELNVAIGNLTDNDGQFLPQVNGITIMNASRVVVEGVTIKNAFQGIYHANGSTTINIRNNFIDNTLYRAIHLKQGKNPNNTQDDSIINPAWNNIEHNLITHSKFDGIDVDSLAEDFVIRENVVIGARDRLLIWTEIDAKNNLIDNNVGIVLDIATEGQPLGNAGKGAFQENGTENQRNPNHPSYDGTTTFFKGNKSNFWYNNHSFYAGSSQRGFDGFVMRKDRFIQFDTIEFFNNVVWTTDPNFTKHNPVIEVTNDVYYLTADATTCDSFFIVNRETNKKIRPASAVDNAYLELVPNEWSGAPTRWIKLPTDNGYFFLKNQNSGKYFRPEDSFENDALVQKPIDFFGDFTQWKEVPTDSGYFYLKNRATGQYFRPNTANTFSQLIQKPTSFDGTFTQWIFTKAN